MMCVSAYIYIYIYLIKCVRIHISFELVLLAFLGNLGFNGNHNPTSYEVKFTTHTYIYKRGVTSTTILQQIIGG